MKKFLAIAVIAASFVACNEGEKKAEEPKATTDTAAAPAPAPADTTKKDTATMAAPAPAATTDTAAKAK